MSVLAVALQIVGAAAIVVAGALFFDSVWAAVLLTGLFAFLLGDALERR